MELISPTITNLIIFVLAIYVGAIVMVGAMLAAALTETTLGKSMGVLAVALCAVNVFGGFLVTRRMLEMFKKKTPAKKAEEKA
jgi:H+-translocating NAD(P) transhydrogenase subunit alpha